MALLEHRLNLKPFKLNLNSFKFLALPALTTVLPLHYCYYCFLLVLITCTFKFMSIYCPLLCIHYPNQKITITEIMSVLPLASNLTDSNQWSSFTTGYTAISMRCHASCIRANSVPIINPVNGCDQSSEVWAPNKAMSHTLASFILYTLISPSLAGGQRLQSGFDTLNGL